VRTVLDNFSAIYSDEEECKRVARVVAEWLVGALAKAHGDPALKRLERLVHGVPGFTRNMGASGVFDDPYKAGLRKVLEDLGRPLGEACEREGHRAALADLDLPPHRLVRADQALCLREERKHKLRSDIAGIVPVPAAWAEALAEGGDPSARQHVERVFIHMLVMLATVLNGPFHAMTRAPLGPIVVPGEGVMELNADGTPRETPVKGAARMEAKRVGDHVRELGCRPALNIDTVRVIGVCETPVDLRAAQEALREEFKGGGRVKSGFDGEDGSECFHLRTVLTNVVADFDTTFAALAREHGDGAWLRHAEESAPQGGAPRGRWRDEAREARRVLMSEELADKPVRFIGEVQLLLNSVYQTRKKMHEPYKAFRADDPNQLYADFLAETHKAQKAEQFAKDGDTPLKRAARDGDLVAAERLLAGTAAAGDTADRDAAFVVACARGHGAVAALPGLAGCAGRAWADAWPRAARVDAAKDMGEAVVAAVMAGARHGDGVDRDTGSGWSAL